ncbi:hypothetical protein As57867_017825, partial [Aphanomyces stellatus]
MDILEATMMDADLLPFHSIDRTNDYYMDDDRDQVDRLLTPWLETYGLTRLSRLIKTFPNVTLVLLSYAAAHGRVDILKRMHDQFHVTDRLFELAAAKGHLPVLEYLHSVGHHDRLMHAAGLAAAHGHHHVLQFMYETYPDEDKQWWIDSSDVGAAAGSGHVDVVAWIFDFWIPAVVPYTDYVDFAVWEALTNATK